MIIGYIIAMAGFDMDDDRLDPGGLQILPANGFRNMVCHDGVAASVDSEQAKVVIHAIVIRHHGRPRLVIPQEVIGGHQVFRTVVIKNQHARIEGMETVPGHA